MTHDEQAQRVANALDAAGVAVKVERMGVVPGWVRFDALDGSWTIFVDGFPDDARIRFWFMPTDWPSIECTLDEAISLATTPVNL